MKRLTLSALQCLVEDHNNKLWTSILEEKKAKVRKLEEEKPPKHITALLKDMEGTRREIKKLTDKLNIFRHEYGKMETTAREAGWNIHDDYGSVRDGVPPKLKAVRKGVTHCDGFSHGELERDPRYISLSKAVLTFEHGTDEDRQGYLAKLGVTKQQPKPKAS